MGNDDFVGDEGFAKVNYLISARKRGVTKDDEEIYDMNSDDRKISRRLREFVKMFLSDYRQWDRLNYMPDDEFMRTYVVGHDGNGNFALAIEGKRYVLNGVLNISKNYSKIVK